MRPYYEHGGITLYHGDCRDVLPTLPNVDLVLTDPPYGLNMAAIMASKSGKLFGNAAASRGNYPASDWDAAPPSREIFDALRRLSRQQIIWGGNHFELPPTRGWLVWDKVTGENNFGDGELAWTNLDTAIRIRRHMWNGMIRKNGESRHGHPTQKPLDLMLWCITLAPPALTVLDPFAGSGTTLCAAKQLGRQAIGIEIDERYCAITASRLSQEVLDLGGAA